MKNETKVLKQPPKFNKLLPILLVVLGALGLILAVILMYETIKINSNSSYVPNCDLNPIINCGTVIKDETSFLHGYTNPIIGLMVFPVLITTGVVLLNGAKLKRWYYLGLEFGTIAGLFFVGYLLYTSFYHIHSLCPYCLGIWAITITTFWYVTLNNLQTGVIKVKKSTKPFVDFISRHHLDILLFVLLLIAFYILVHFWYFFGQYFK